MAYDAGTAFLQVVPSFLGAVESISEEMSKDGEIAGKAFKESFDQSVGDLHAKVDLDTGAADAKLLALRAAADEASGSASEGGIAKLATDAAEGASGIGAMLSGVLLLGPALIPLAGLAAGALSVVPALFAGLGVGAAAVVVGISGIIPAITAYRATLNTTGETAAQIATKHRDLANAMAGLTPAGQTFVAFVATQLLPVFSGLKTAVQTAFLPGVTAGLRAMLPFFQTLIPFIVAAAKGIGDTVSQIGNFLGSINGLSEINVILAAGNGFMKTLGDAAVTLFEAFTTIGAQAAPIVSQIGKGILGMVDAFSRWVSGGGFEKFVQWLQVNGPPIVKGLEGFVKGVVALGIALVPTGVFVLKLLGPIGSLLDYLGKTPAALVAVTLGLGALFAVIFVFANTNPFGILITAIAFFIVGITLLVTHWRAVWSEIKSTFDAVVRFLRSGFGTLIILLTGPIAPLLLLALHWQQVWSLIKSVADAVWKWFDGNIVQPLVTFFTVTAPGALNAVSAAFSTAWGAIVATLAAAWGWIYGNVIAPIGTFFTATIPGWIGTLLGFFEAIPGRIGGALGGLFGTITGAFGDVPDWVNTNVISPMVAFFTAVPGNIYSAIKAGVSGAADIAKSIINGVIGLMNDAINFYDSHRPSVFGVSLLPHIDDIPTLHTGGIVPGPPGADVPAILQAGELVIPRGAVSAFNAPVAAAADGRPNVTQEITVTAYDPRTAAVETLNRAGFALKTRGF